MNKGAELSYNIVYLITAALFQPVCPVCPDIIRILWISTFRKHYPHFVDIIRIPWISWIYPHLVDIICIGHITSYLALNICTIFQIYSSSVSDWCIPYFTVCNRICFSVTSSFWIFRFVSEYKLNTNPIGIYVPPFNHFNKR